jgi:peptide/nickel transport system permease protein
MRLVSGIAILATVSALIFLGIEALPGDAAQAVLGQQATPETLAAQREKYELDRPALERYGDWIAGLLSGDLGTSVAGGQPVSDLLSDRIKNTLVLAALTALILVPLAIGLGAWSALRANKPDDHVIATTTLAFLATPEFVIGTLVAALLAVQFEVFPANSLIDSNKPLLSQLDYLVLPIITLVLVSVAQGTRMIRATMIDVLRSDYVQMAALKGVPRGRLLLRHALPNALGPTLQIIAFTLAYLVGGIITVEVVFGYPGLGSALVDAVQNRDFPVVQAIVMIATGVYVVVILLADIAAIALNPRLRRSSI